MSGSIHHLNDLAGPCVFDKQSLGPFLCVPICIGSPLFRSYRTNLPSSLAMIHSSTYGYSPRLPVSVYGTDSIHLKLRGFSWKSAYNHYPLVRRLTVLSGFSTSGGFTCQTYTYALQRTIPSVRGFVTPSLPHRNDAGTGILTCFPSAAPFGLTLGSD